MNGSTAALFSSLALIFSVGAGGTSGLRVEGPFTHGNLAIYVVLGKGQDPRRFLTLDEGLRSNTVAVRELGARSGEDRARVNELEIENESDDWLFLQAGDVIQGGKQDRTIAIDVAIPPHSKPQPITAFCVERGRWTARAQGLAFRESPAIVGGNALKKSIQGEKSQARVWEEVARESSRAAAKIAAGAGTPAAALSPTGTYNAIVEDRKIVSDRAEYVKALLPRVERRRGAIGIVVAIDGEITAADVYGSAALFGKIARKLLDSYALEAALARSEENASAAPTAEAARAFLEETGRGRITEDRVLETVRQTRKESASAIAFEYEETDPRTGTRTLLHANVVKK